MKRTGFTETAVFTTEYWSSNRESPLRYVFTTIREILEIVSLKQEYGCLYLHDGKVPSVLRVRSWSAYARI